MFCFKQDPHILKLRKEIIIQPIFIFQPVFKLQCSIQTVVFNSIAIFTAANGKGSTIMPWLVVTMIGIVFSTIGIFGGSKLIFKHISFATFFRLHWHRGCSAQHLLLGRGQVVQVYSCLCNFGDCASASRLSALFFQFVGVC